MPKLAFVLPIDQPMLDDYRLIDFAVWQSCLRVLGVGNCHLPCLPESGDHPRSCMLS